MMPIEAMLSGQVVQEATGKNVILLPMGAADDGAHSQNEKIDIRCGVAFLHFHINPFSLSGTTLRGQSCLEHMPMSSASSRHIKRGVVYPATRKICTPAYQKYWQSGASTWYLAANTHLKSFCNFPFITN